MSSYPDDILKLEPLLDRLERLEARMKSADSRGGSGELEMRVRFQSRDIEALQTQLDETRQRVVEESSLSKKRFREIAQEVPAMLESMLTPQLSRMRERMHADLHKLVDEKLAAFEKTVEKKISERMESLEQALIDQAGIITTLSERAIQSDTNLQRLISAVEKLCERGETQPAEMPSEPRELPFESQLSDAIKRQPEDPPQRDSGFRPRIVKEDDERHRPRPRPLTHI
jgi:uncharacterized coiled-coil protein SlyX